MTERTPSLELSGVWIPLITPFLDEPGLPIDHPSLGHLARHCKAAGVHGLVVGSTTGEATALSRDERLACWLTVAQSAPGLPLMLGTGGQSMADALQDLLWLKDCRHANHLPLDAVLLAAPAYIRPSTAGLKAWFETLASAAPAPVVVYDIPYRTGSTLPTQLLLSLATHWNIYGVKDCGADLGKTLALLHDGRLRVMAGEDLQVLSHLAHGGSGCISASAHLHPQLWVMLYRCMKAGHLAQAQAIWQQLVPWIENTFAEPNPAPLKAALSAQGLGSAAVRPPLTPASESVQARWKTLSQQLAFSPR
jgi:4-hydroxy-tetrahydrodipicolinate synthase